MTSVLGVLKPQTVSGKQIRNGNSALVRTGKNGLLVHALGEERMSRDKGSPGYEKSMRAILSAAELDIADVDVVAVSSCCEKRELILASGLDPLVGRQGGGARWTSRVARNSVVPRLRISRRPRCGFGRWRRCPRPIRWRGLVAAQS